MTSKSFRRLALGMDGAIESAHMAHPDFRANGRVFATLGYPDNQWGMVALTPDQQQEYVRDYPTVFVPAKGAWGRGGSTMVRLDAVDEDTLGEAMTLAWRNTIKTRVAAKPVRKRAAKRA